MERIPFASERLPSLDGLRAVSIAMVIGAHAIGAFGLPGWLQPFAFIIDGDLGVRIFFCISGFLITHLLLHERKRTGSIDLKAFYVRRALRIIPVAYAFIAVLLILTALGQLHLPACNFVTALTFTKNYACAALPDGHLWSRGRGAILSAVAICGRLLYAVAQLIDCGDALRNRTHFKSGGISGGRQPIHVASFERGRSDDWCGARIHGDIAA